MVYALTVATLAAIAAAALAGDSLELTPSNFDAEVIQSDGPTMVLFYAPWCGHCKNIFPKWEKAATATKGIVTLAKLDADKHGALGGKYGVSGFPTIKVFGSDKAKPTDYQGPREVDGLVQGALKAAKDVIDSRLGKGGGGGGGGGDGPSEVVELTDGSFDKEVLASDDVWIVAFTAPWCGHCKNLMPEWARASAQLKGKAKIGNVDATVNQGLAGKYGVKSYPTIKVFLGGKKSGDAVDYDGGRTASDIVAYAEEEYLKTLPPPEVLQAYDAAGMANCTGKQICFMGYLPLLQDSGKEGREAFVKTLQEVADAYKRRPFGWVWIEGTTQPDLESFFRVADLPALVAINAKKARYALMRGQFSVKGVTAFVGKLNVGRGTTAMDGDLPAFVDGSKWDGEEFVMEEFEEEFDLSDLDDIDLDDEDVAKDEL